MAHLAASVFLLTFALSSTACKGTPAASADSAAPPAPAAAAGTAGPMDGAVPAGAPAAEPRILAGAVAETMNSGGYTYLRLAGDGGDVWVAASEFPVKTGERLTVTVDMSMANFHSKTLNREFETIYFVSQVRREGEPAPVAGGPGGMPALARSHGGEPAAQAPAMPDVQPNAPPDGGYAIADVWAKRDALAGKTVAVRGTVVKVNNAIMDRNWFHLRDGSGAAKDGTHDLTVTSNATVKLGDVVTVSGTLATKKDFGAGYAYDAILENATVTPR